MSQLDFILTHLFVEMEPASTATSGCDQSHVSSRPKRKRKPNPVYTASLQEDRTKNEQAESEGHNIKRARKAVQKDSPAVVGTATLPSKGTYTQSIHRSSCAGVKENIYLSLQT